MIRRFKTENMEVIFVNETEYWQDRISLDRRYYEVKVEIDKVIAKARYLFEIGEVGQSERTLLSLSQLSF